ncbi:hypothetical protein TWF192_002654 [Orbilia oligospora]|uniref:Uncharacterized protein n=1 Tax=Orbilia oligospora TaxID=2813651 RepID=A0A6G1MF11_ORBOL|nr:hypothetical protein TWF191_011095 [Orbilia oligospora]KAF3215448.1 hypothetical protein TWF679_003967 [Orbilia oligospora]KAF3255296.1 hypothetical protein TWF192_002654 [Orbilia oligospora]
MYSEIKAPVSLKDDPENVPGYSKCPLCAGGLQLTMDVDGYRVVACLDDFDEDCRWRYYLKE